MINLNEETARIKKIMGITEDENIPEVEKTETDEVVEKLLGFVPKIIGNESVRLNIKQSGGK